MTEASTLLRTYLRDHLAGATGGVELVRRMCAAEHGTDLEPALNRLATEIEQDAERLQDLMRELDVRPAPLKIAIAWIAEKLGRLKLNRRLFARSPLSLLLELEGLQMGVAAKRALWRALQEMSRREPRFASFPLGELRDRADDQLVRIAELHTRAARRAFEVRAERSWPARQATAGSSYHL